MNVQLVRVRAERVVPIWSQTIRRLDLLDMPTEMRVRANPTAPPKFSDELARSTCQPMGISSRVKLYSSPISFDQSHSSTRSSISSSSIESAKNTSRASVW